MKNIVYISLICLLGVCTSCQKADPVVRNTEGELNDIFANTEGSGTQRLFEAREIRNDTVYFDIPYYYPVDSDNETDLSRLILRAAISSDAKLAPALGKPMDLRAPFDFTITSGSGTPVTYTVVARRIGVLTIDNISISYQNQNGEEQSTDAVILDDELRFFVLPGTDLSSATLSYEINRHSSGSIASGSVIDLSQPQTFVVSAPGEVEKAYTLNVTEPVRLDRGFGIHRRLWIKSAADFGGFTGASESAIAVSGDHLVILTSTSPKSRLRIYDRFSGAYIQDMYNPHTSLSDQIVEDQKGQLLLANRASLNQHFKIYKYQDALDTNPELLIDWVNDNPAGIPSGARDIGRRVNLYGDLDGEAAIMAIPAQGTVVYRWRVSGGQLVSNDPDILPTTPIESSSFGYRPEAQPTSAAETGNYFVNYQQDLAYINGTTHERISSFSFPGSVVFHNAMTFTRFNNVDYLAMVKYLHSYNLNRLHLALFDVSNPSMIPMPYGDPGYDLFRVYESEEYRGSVATGGTHDVTVGFSDGGDRMQVYMLHSGTGILAHEFTVFSAE